MQNARLPEIFIICTYRQKLAVVPEQFNSLCLLCLLLLIPHGMHGGLGTGQEGRHPPLVLFRSLFKFFFFNEYVPVSAGPEEARRGHLNEPWSSSGCEAPGLNAEH